MGKFDVIDSKGKRNYMIGDILEFKYKQKIPICTKILTRKTINSYLNLDPNTIITFIGYVRSSDNRPPKKFFVDESTGVIYYVQKDYSNSFHVGEYISTYEDLIKLKLYKESEI